MFRNKTEHRYFNTAQISLVGAAVSVGVFDGVQSAALTAAFAGIGLVCVYFGRNARFGEVDA